MACITEDGRILDTSPLKDGKGVMELINGSWVPAKSPLYGAELYSARVLSTKELSRILKSGKLS